MFQMILNDFINCLMLEWLRRHTQTIGGKHSPKKTIEEGNGHFTCT